MDNSLNLDKNLFLCKFVQSNMYVKTHVQQRDRTYVPSLMPSLRRRRCLARTFATPFDDPPRRISVPS